MPLQLERQPRRIYERNPLKVVLCQLRFPPLLRVDDPSFVAPFQEALGRRYPRRSEEQLLLNVAVGAAEARSPAPPPRIWRFRSSDDAWTVSLARDSVSVETSAYARFEEFEERAREALTAAESRLGVVFRERLGLRYINEIHHPDGTNPTGWRALLNSELLGLVGGRLLGEEIIHALEEIRLRQRDGIVLLRHGFLGNEITDGAPHYVLDFDYYDELPQDFDVQATISLLAQYRQVIHDLFETSITDSLREHLGISETIEESHD